MLLAAAAAFRALGYLAAGPLLAPSDDSLRYAHGGLVALFSDPFAPSGYPILLAAVRLLWPNAAAVSLVQHLLGLLSVALLCLTGHEVARVARIPSWLAALPAIFVAFSGDQWFFEHSLMSETLFTVLVIGGVLALLRTGAVVARPRMLVWASVAGAAAAAAAVTRPPGLVVAVFGALWLLACGPRPPRARIGAAAAYTTAAVVVLAAYLLAAGGGQNGIGSYAGWTLYGRVATFADCARFTPPAGTRGLCESRPPDTRPGIYFYLFGAGAGPGQTSPAQAVFGSAPRGNAQLRAFGIRAIEAQPVDYLRTAAKDAFRYVDPTYGSHRPEAGIGPEFVYLQTSLAPYPARDAVERLYGYKVSRGSLLYPFESWLVLSRVPGLLWLAALAAVLGGLVVGRGGGRRQLALVAGVAGAIAVTPVLTVTYEYRYGIPAQGLALLAGIVGAWLVAGRGRAGPD